MTIVTQDIVKNELPYPRSSNGQQAFACNTRKIRSVQKPVKDLSLALPYTLSVFRHVKYSGWGSLSTVYLNASDTVWQYSDPYSSFLNADFSNFGGLGLADRQLYNSAYAKFVDHLKNDSSDVLTLIRERKLARDMIASRSLQVSRIAETTAALHKASRSKSKRAKAQKNRLAIDLVTLITADPNDMPKNLERVRRSKTWRNMLSTPAAAVLEFSWGWSPMVKDIYNAVAYFYGDQKSFEVWGSSKRALDFQRHISSSGNKLDQFSTGTLRVRIGGRVVVDSRSIAEMERLGLTNLPQSLWETVPYSWLVDYFSSVGTCLAALDDGLICRMTNTYVTRFVKDGLENVRYSASNGVSGWEFLRSRVHMRRQNISIPKPLLTVFWPDITPRRAVTAVALTILKLTRISVRSPYNPT